MAILKTFGVALLPAFLGACTAQNLSRNIPNLPAMPSAGMTPIEHLANGIGNDGLSLPNPMPIMFTYTISLNKKAK